jgi:type 1 glutamine amidotransferase
MSERLDVLVVTGGHPYDEPRFRAMLDALPGVTWRGASYPEAAAEFAPARVAAYDALLFYDFGQSLPESARRDLLDTLRTGIGVVVLHHALHSQIDWPEYRRIVGGCWESREFAAEGRSLGPSTASPGQTVAVRVADRAHPITAGLSDWSWTEEPYAKFWASSASRVLLETEHPQADRALAWCHRYERSRVVYLQPGHDAVAFDHANYRRLLAQALRWSAERDR